MKLKPSSVSTMSCSTVFEVSLLSRVYNHALWNKATVDVRTCGIVSHVIECAEWDGRMVLRHFRGNCILSFEIQTFSPRFEG